MKGVLSGPSSGLAGPSLNTDSDSERTWHKSSSMHYACSYAWIESQQSEGFAVWSLFF